MGQPVRAGIGDPAMKSLGAEPPAIDHVRFASAHADDAPARPVVLDPDVNAAAIRAQKTGGLHPSVGSLDDVLIDPHGPVRT